MTTAVSSETIEELWRSFRTAGASGNDEITLEGLRGVMRSLGHEPTDDELRRILLDADAAGSITFDKFVALVTSLQGDQESRLEVAFGVFDQNRDGLVAPDEMRGVLGQFGLSEAELEQIFREADRDGDGAIDFADFCTLMPGEHEQAADHYRDSHILFASAVRPDRASARPPPLPPPAPRSKLEQLPRAASQRLSGDVRRGTSRLQMQIGLFRLLQGAAYRSFRENYCANSETHLRAKKLPYTIDHFVAFVSKAIALYKELGVVEPACFPVLDAVTASIAAEHGRLQDRIASWPTLEKTPAMLATATAMRRQRSEAATIRDKFAAGVEFALTLRKKNLGLADVVEDLLAIHELNRLRRLELHEELAAPPAHDGSDPRDYLDSWNRVLLSSADEEIDGAMMPALYWYEDFMPKLLAACSIATADGLAFNTAPDEAALDRWFAMARDAGELTRYGMDVAERFLHCAPWQKLALRQAWRLTRHYLNGVQKRRERLEFGRESGFLSQYVAFIDVDLGRSDVRNARMRVSYPYYLGPPVWRFLHTTAEIVCSRDARQQKDLIRLFKEFFQLFAAIYPCPYCRHHLSAYVVQNREVEMYPLEYLILGRHPDHADFRVSIDDKLATITDGLSLRLFLWKLHNAVAASIARTEPWYHRDDAAFYTTRHWPSLDFELARARALNHDSISTDRLWRIHGLLKPAARLAALRRELQRALRRGDAAELMAVCDQARAAVAGLEAALASGAFLEQTYAFDPDPIDDAPHFTPEEEAFARSGAFVEA
jgi:Ca2+-binding EF-hand superfamily protein